MQYNDFLHLAKEQLGVQTQDEVMNISRAFLHTLTDHMAGNAADKLASQLPAPLADVIKEIHPEDRDQGQRFSLSEFYERVADRAGVPDEQGQHYTLTYMKLLGQLVTAGEIHKLRLTLPDTYAPLFEGVVGLQEKTS
ncbi:DUF2267 domain-containing protein [Rudanella lutea]|uniref:DUF2267 domain-containing protein n=1 Tax=Rudanella lutea TaxID=451374 RepID=UPI00037BCC01|nr:DUF2267 domain-containing protein [Rudanella lutea]